MVKRNGSRSTRGAGKCFQARPSGEVCFAPTRHSPLAGFAVGFMFFDAPIASAGPFSWLAGKNQQQQQAPAPGGGPGTLPFFGGRSGAFRNQPDVTAVPRASDLPVNDPETYMITNPPLGTPTLSSRNIDATKAAIQRYQSIVAQGGWPMVPAKAMHPGRARPGSRGSASAPRGQRRPRRHRVCPASTTPPSCRP